MVLAYGHLQLRSVISWSSGLLELEEFLILIRNCSSMDLGKATHHDSLGIFFFFFKTLFSKTSFRFTVKLRGFVQRFSMYFLSPHSHSLLYYEHALLEWYLFYN